MGYHAVRLLLDGKFNRVVGTKSNNIVDFDITEALNMHKSIDKTLYEMSKEISI